MNPRTKMCLAGLTLLCAGILLGDSTKPTAVALAQEPVATTAPPSAPGAPLLATSTSNQQALSTRAEAPAPKKGQTGFAVSAQPLTAATSPKVPAQQQEAVTGSGMTRDEVERGGNPGCFCGIDAATRLPVCWDDLNCTDPQLVPCDPATGQCPPGFVCVELNCCPPPLDFACFPICPTMPPDCINPGDCITGFQPCQTGGGVFGACCDDSTGVCTEGVDELLCQPPLRFGGANSLCSDLVPPCGGGVKCAPPGDDCFTTPCDGTTTFDFSGTPIPADFFFPGSPPFTGVVSFGGLGGFPGDTIIRRLNQMCWPDPLPVKDTTPIELVALSLISCQPIIVGGQLFDVHVQLAGPQRLGTLSATKTHVDGGTYTATLPVDAEFLFGPVGGPPTLGPVLAPPATLQTTPAGTWLQTCCDTGCGGTGFFPGWDLDLTTPCCRPTCHPNPAGGHEHCVYPPDCPQCPSEPVGSCCDDSTGVCTDGIAQSACPAPSRFTANVLCADLVPPCGGGVKCAPPGDDCFTTPCDGTTTFDFGLTPIPPDFFFPGSPPFTGIVSLGGPGGFPGDTIVRRLNQMCWPDPLPVKDTTPIELVALSLISCQPIDVGGQLFDVHVQLAGPQQQGTLSATKTHVDGGTYTATLPVDAEFLFGPVGGPPSIGPLPAPPAVLQTSPDGTWLQTCCDTGCGGTGFFPGWDLDFNGQPCCKPTCHPNPAGGHDHCVYPPDCPQCPPDPTGACCDKGGVCVGDITELDCASRDGVWNPNASCSDPNFFCNPVGCSFDNGPPSDDVPSPSNPTWPWAFVDPLNQVVGATVDDFILNDQGTNPCHINNITTWIGHVFATGGSPADYQGVHVTIYANATPKGPGGQPEADGSHTEYFPGGVVFTQFVTNFTWAAASMPCFNSDPTGNITAETFMLDIPVTGLDLDKKTKYWLEILVQYDTSLHLYSTGLMLSQINHMHESQSGNPVGAVPFWTGAPVNSRACASSPPAGSLMGVAFKLNGTKCTKAAPAADDCWSTVCGGGTQYDFSQSPIPADFFGPGSDPFTGVVELGMGSVFPDTIVRRLDDMCFDGTLPVTAVVPVEMVQMELVSCQPVIVTFNGGQNPEPWDLRVFLDGPQQVGSLTVTKVNPLGGTFDSVLLVQAGYEFTDPTGQSMLFLPGLVQTLSSIGLPWIQDPPPGGSICGNGGFYPGFSKADPSCCEPSCHQGPSPGHEHCVVPPECPMCVGACCDKSGICIGDVSESQCLSQGFKFHPNASCGANPNLPTPVCQAHGCDYDNGPPLDDFGSPASQYDDFPAEVFSAEAADDFILKDVGNNPCLITGARFWATHFNVPAGIIPDPVTQWTGVTVTVYDDAAPKGPSGHRNDDGTFTGLVVATQTVPMPLVSVVTMTMPCQGTIFQIDVPLDMSLLKNHKYWIVFQPHMDRIDDPAGGPGYGQVAIMLSQNSNGHNAQQIFNIAGLTDWTEISGNSGSGGTCNTLPPGSRRDLAFSLSGQKCGKPAPAGDDCWTTLCGGGTQYDFSQTPIPANFFGPGSDPFGDVVELGMGTVFPDTILRRLNDMCFDGTLPVTDSTPIEMVQLELVSCQQITVTFNGGQNPQLWDLRVFLDGPQQQGSLTVTKINPLGGTFDSVLLVQAGYEFTDPTGQSIVFLPGLIQILTSVGLPWIQDPPPGGSICGNGGFYPGFDKDNLTCCDPSCHQGPAPGHEHCVVPPECPECVRPCCLPGGFCVLAPVSQCLASGGELVSACLGDLNGNGLDDACEKPPCADCGPGPHWIDGPPPCPAGSDSMASSALIGIDTDLDCMADTSMILSGPVTVARTGPLDDSVNFPGTAPVDGHLETIDTEIVSMSLSGGGVTLTAGAGAGLTPSLGFIVEQAGDPTLANTQFDVYFKVDLGGGTFGYNQTALQITSVINCIPPNTTYIHPVGCIPLFDAPVGGVNIANLVTADHKTYPRHGACCLSDGTCVESTAADCTGFYWGDGTDCVNVICTGACCNGPRACAQVSEDDCLAAGFNFRGVGTECPTQGTRTAVHNSLPVVHWVDPAINCLEITDTSEGCVQGELIDAWMSSTEPTEQICHQFGVVGSPAIPADFFEPGSDPFTGAVCMLGEPLGATPFGVYDLADTLVRRSADPFDRCELPSPTEVTVDIEIVALNLKSIAPIIVTGVGGPTTWDVAVDLSSVPSPLGSITAKKTHCNGGTYNSLLPVQPRFTFTKVSGPGIPIGSVSVLDTGLESIPPIILEQLSDPPWVSDADPNLFPDSPWCTDFHPGLEEANQSVACDCNSNGINDACDPDCNGNGIADECDILSGTSLDANGNGFPDECEKLGDMNCDQVVDLPDIEPFIQALIDPAGYLADHDCRIMNADASGDGLLNGVDVDYFADLLLAP